MRKFRSIGNRLSAAVFFLLQGFLLPAQSISISLDKDTITFNETVVLRLTAEARDFSSFAELSEIDGLIVVDRTNNYSFNSSNGKIKFTQTFTLSPYKVGTFTIGPAWVQVGSKRIFSNKLKIVVKAGDKNELSNDVFMRCEPDKKQAVIGEQITLSIRLYARFGVEITPGNQRPLAKSFNGFWYQEGSTVAYGDTVSFNGILYRSMTIYEEYVFPNTVGKLKIPSYSYLCFIRQNAFPTGDPLVDDIMGIPVPVEFISTEVPIEVLPLPAKNKPLNFAGDVGKFSLSASIDKENVKVSDAVKLTVTITGKGNINFIQLPQLKFPSEIESYLPVSTDSIAIGNDGVEGEKTFTITLIPKKEGNYTLPGIAFSYYDPDEKDYVTVQTPEFKLNVARGNATADISQNNLPESFLDGPSYGREIKRILWIAIPAILLIVLYFSRSARKKKEIQKAAAEFNSHKTEDFFIEPVKAKPDILSMLQLAERFILNGNFQSGIGQLYETLMSAVLFKTELNREEGSIHQIRYRLGIKKLSPELINEVINALEESAAQRYTPQNADRSTITASLQKTRRLALELLS